MCVWVSEALLSHDLKVICITKNIKTTFNLLKLLNFSNTTLRSPLSRNCADEIFDNCASNTWTWYVIIRRDSVRFCDGVPHWKSVCLRETKHNKCEHHKRAKGAALEVQISEDMILRRTKEEVPTKWFLLGPLTIVCAANWSQTASPRSMSENPCLYLLLLQAPDVLLPHHS